MVLDLLSGKAREPAGCVVRAGVARLEISSLYPFLTAVEVGCTRKEPWTATLTFESRRDEQGSWTVEDSGLLAPWEPIVIEASFGSRTEEVMRGYVREVEASYPEDPGAAEVTVHCQDDSLALDREHVRRAWGTADVPATDALLLGEIAGRHGLAPHPESGQGLSGLVLSQDATDVEFLRERAEANGYELIFAGGLVYFGPMRLAGEPQPTMLVYAGTDSNCLRFEVRADGHKPEKVAYQLAAAQGAGVEEKIVESALPPLGPEPATGGGPGLKDFVWHMRRVGGMDEAELAARAQGKADELAMRVTAEGDLDGSLYGHVLRVGETVAVDGVGQRFAGLYYVDAVRHRFSEDGYRQSFKLLRNAYGDNVPGGGAGLGGLSASVSFSFSIGF